MNDEVPETFNVIKRKVLELINLRRNNHVNNFTKNKKSGVYLLYVDNFTSSSVLPIYIGRTNNFQKRWKEHKKEILALNRLSYNEYYRYFFRNTIPFYEGSYKSCKIFKYMVDNNCQLSDLKMVIIKNTDQDESISLERQLIQEFLSSFFGFNQLLSLTDTKDGYNKTNGDSVKLKIWEFNNLKNLTDFGYSRFNFLKSFLISESEEISPNILSEYESLKIELEFPSERYDQDYKRINDLYTEYSNQISNLEEAIISSLSKTSVGENKLLLGRMKKVIFENDIPAKKYLATYFKNKNYEFDYLNFCITEIKEIERIKEKMNSLEAEYESLYFTKKSFNKHGLIYPFRKYDSFPLKDEILKIDEPITENELQLFFDLSNSGKSYQSYYYNSEIIRLTVRWKINNQINCQVYYISNGISDAEYIEEDFYPDLRYLNGSLYRRKFNPIKADDYFDRRYITLEAEYKTGLNDYSHKKQEHISLVDALTDIRSNILLDDMSVTAYYSESKKCFELTLNSKEENHDIIKRIIKSK
ncbi:GIY-YIG nuclease family protein [Sporosarcina sp. 6E9]|uniref:GIY-YIG nuclease family protein n=1 Tax=Sporosarcina sp. 6E9 TaxID=2819235 RepID=UPI001B305658|nr:GIY-YIG nuclease family protein [Sporosarcina sp. 6E9]